MHALILDDRLDDVELLAHELERGGLVHTWRHVATKADYLEQLEWPPDVILADYSLPQFSAPEALELLQTRGLDIPFIVISGSVGEETAVNLLKKGAADYLLKDRLGRVSLAVKRALDERAQRLAVQKAELRLREEEERTRFALEASRVGTWEADLRTGGARWSETLEALHGLEPGSFGGTLDAFLEQMHPEDRQHAIAEIDRATREHTESSILYRSVRADGTVHWIRGRGRTFYDESGVPIRAAGVGFDVTEVRALEAQYRQAQKMEAVGQLAGGVAHDFNNLLTVIQGFCSIVLEQPGHPDEPELKQILQAADRATSLTRQLLAFSRRQILETSVFDLRESVDRLVPMLRRLIGENIDIGVTTPSEACAVRADCGQVEQVILNLAVNARDAMTSGGKLLFEIDEVTLDQSYCRTREDVVPGVYVMLAVSDTGSGMDAKVIERIFEPFFTTKGKDKGTGLGLSTVFGIIKQSGGHIAVYSEIGRGTTFKVYLPRVVDAAVERVETPVPAIEPDGASEMLMVVEDDEGVRQLIASVLKRRGYRMLIAATPGEALRMFEQETPAIDLLLTDVVLPEMSGRDLAEQLRQRQPGLPVLFMSGYTDAAIVDHGTLQKGTPFIQKPFTPDSLSLKLRQVLDAVGH